MKADSDSKCVLLILTSLLLVDLSKSQTTGNTVATDLGSSAQSQPPQLRTESNQPVQPVQASSNYPYVPPNSDYPGAASNTPDPVTFLNFPTSLPPSDNPQPSIFTASSSPPAPSFIPQSPTSPLNQPSPFPSSIPPSNTPQFSINFQSTLSASVLQGDSPLHFQFTFWNVYKQAITDLNLDLQSTYTNVQPQIANIFHVTSSRITDVVFLTDPAGYVVVRFTIQPGPTIETSTIVALKTFLVIVNVQAQASRVQLNLGNTQILSPLKAYYNWTDTGVCPTQPCGGNGPCLCSLSGTYSCKNAPAPVTPQPTYNSLLGLIAIPIFILIVLIILIVIYLVKLHSQKEKSRIALNDLISNIGGASRMSGMTMADSGVRNLVYTTMGKSFAMHFNENTFSMPKHVDDSDDFNYSVDDKVDYRAKADFNKVDDNKVDDDANDYKFDDNADDNVDDKMDETKIDFGY